MPTNSTLPPLADLFGEPSNAFDFGRGCARATRLMCEVRSWAAAQNLRSNVIEATVLSLALCSPPPFVPALGPAAHTAVWVTALDDVFDGDEAVFDHASCDSATFVPAAFGAAESRIDDSLLLALRDIVGDLARQPRWPTFAEVWWQHIHATVDAFVWERQLRYTDDPVSLEDYLAHSASFALGPVIVAWWAIIGEADIADRLTTLLNALEHAQLALRLANDLATADRERAEGCRANAVLLGARPREIDDLIDRHTAACHRLLRPLSPHPAAVSLGRLLDFDLGWYRTSDTRSPR